MKDVTNYLSSPPVSSTNQINELAKLDNVMVETYQEWANQLDEFVQLDDPAKLEDWASKLVNFEELSNQIDDDIVNCNNQPNLFVSQDMSFMS